MAQVGCPEFFSWGCTGRGEGGIGRRGDWWREGGEGSPCGSFVEGSGVSIRGSPGSLVCGLHPGSRRSCFLSKLHKQCLAVVFLFLFFEILKILFIGFKCQNWSSVAKVIRSQSEIFSFSLSIGVHFF